MPFALCVRALCSVLLQPEGFAVAFSAMTSVGPMICGAIAMHNIPEGLVIAGECRCLHSRSQAAWLMSHVAHTCLAADSVAVVWRAVDVMQS